MKHQQQSQGFDIMKFLNLENIKQEQPQHFPPLQKEKSVDPSQPKKISYKNKYLNKVKQSWGGISTSIRARSEREIELSLDIEAEKKLRNKNAARESRQRKKIYIEIVEKEIRTLEDQLDQVNKEIEDYKVQIHKANQESQQNIGGPSSIHPGHVFKKLMRFVQEEESLQLNADINLAVDSLCYRFALLGKQRISKINKGYNQILKIAIPTLHQYIMWCAAEGLHMFADENSKNPQNQWYGQLKHIFSQLTPQQKQKLIGMREGFIAQRQQFSKLISALFSKREDMKVLCGQIDDLHQDLRKIFTPKQLAKWLIFNQGNNYKQQLRFIEKICIQDNPFGDLGEPKKKTKLNQDDF